MGVQIKKKSDKESKNNKNNKNFHHLNLFFLFSCDNYEIDKKVVWISIFG
jgi:hypothetical protein